MTTEEFKKCIDMIGKYNPHIDKNKEHLLEIIMDNLELTEKDLEEDSALFRAKIVSKVRDLKIDKVINK